MNNTKTGFILTGETFTKMIHGAAINLQSEAQKINDLNVFPVPDGDTGDNMLSTLMGGVERAVTGEGLGVTARKVADGMLLSARGNSGVILSQFFDGIAAGFEGLETADAKAIGKAFRKGVRRAYRAVMKPAEGTILTVASDATEYACNTKTGSVEDFLGHFVTEARRSLDRTPELLPVLKSAGVVDSGGAGLLSIIEGMCRVFDDDWSAQTFDNAASSKAREEIDFDRFSADDILEYGYCTELLVRLQTSKTDIDSFDAQTVIDVLTELGDSIATVKSGSILKIHVHTKTPDRVLALCQKYGEFLKVKIENMSLQHNSIEAEGEAVRDAEKVMTEQTQKDFGVVVAACGEGIKQTFLECGADFIVEGGQSMNPSAEDFIRAFEAVNAKTVFVYPNNGNVILAARQAMKMYDRSDVRVIESRNVGEGYASLSMMDTSSGDADAIEAELNANMQGVVTAEIARCIRDAEMQNVEIHTGDYIGYVGKSILSASNERLEASLKLIDSLDLDNHALFLLFSGLDSSEEETEQICNYIAEHHPACEVYPIYGGQDIYSYIMVAE